MAGQHVFVAACVPEQKLRRLARTDAELPLARGRKHWHRLWLPAVCLLGYGYHRSLAELRLVANSIVRSADVGQIKAIVRGGARCAPVGDFGGPPAAPSRETNSAATGGQRRAYPAGQRFKAHAGAMAQRTVMITEGQGSYRLAQATAGKGVKP